VIEERGWLAPVKAIHESAESRRYGNDRKKNLYGHITINFFDKFDRLETQYPLEIIAKVHPNLKPADLVAQTGAVVKQVRIELLTLVDQAQ
jgi:hypothetical protein